MTIPRNFYIKEVLEQVVDMMYDDLSADMEFDADEPTYVGNPIFLAKYPCLVSVPSSSGTSTEQEESPLFGRTLIQHIIVYVFKGMRPEDHDFVDPSVQALSYGQLMMDWIVYALINDRLPLKDPDGANVDTNWAADLYYPPFEFVIESEYQSALRETRQEQNLYAPCVRFRTISQSRYV